MPKGASADFPRGGGVGLSPYEFKQIVKEVDHDILFSQVRCVCWHAA
jgi:hypothetical protein